MGGQLERPPAPVPVAYLVGDGDAQVEASVLCNHTVPVAGTSSAQLGHAPHLLVPIGQHQVEPLSKSTRIFHECHFTGWREAGVWGIRSPGDVEQEVCM